MATSASKIKDKSKLQLLWENGKRCAICGRKIKNIDDLTIDHIVPLAKGGKNVAENLQLAHRSCNAAKSDMMPDEYDKLRKHSKRRRAKLKLRRLALFWQ